MMLSSNQVMAISGPLWTTEYIENCLEFGLNYAGHSTDLKDRERYLKLSYQLTKSGDYCIGWYKDTLPEGWKEYPFDFDVEIVARIIRQQMEKIDIPNEYDGDGSEEKGFIMKSIDGNFSEWYDRGLIEPSYGIIGFSPFWCFYAK